VAHVTQVRRGAAVSSTTNSVSWTPSVSFAVTNGLNTAIASGERVIWHCWVAIDGAPATIQDLSVNSWNLVTSASNGSIVTGALFSLETTAAYAAGAFPAIQVDIDVATEQFSCVMYAHKVASGATVGTLTATTANGSSTNSNPASVTNSSGSSRDVTVIAFRAGDSTVVATVAPASYGSLLSQAGGGTAGASSNGAHRQITIANSTSEDPGTFTSASEQWACATVGVYEITSTAYSMPAAPGSYSLTGTAATLTKESPGYTMPAAPGSYSLTGTAATLDWSGAPNTPILQGRKAVAITGSLSTDTNVSLTSGWEAGAGGANYTPAENDVVYIAVGVGHTADVDVTITTSGYAELADLFADNTYDANFGLFRKVMGSTPDTSVDVGPTTSANASGAALIEVWSGVDPTTPEDVTPVTVTGTGTGRPDPPSITPSTAGSVVTVFGVGAALSGNALAQSGAELTDFLSINSPDGVDIAIGGGHFEWSSGAFDPVGWVGGATNISNSWVAASVALRPAPGSTNYSMPADAGSYTLTGTDAGFLYSQVIAADPGSYALTGTAANLYRNRLVEAVPGSYSLTGTDVSFNIDTSAYTMPADPGSYALTGTAASLLFGRSITAVPGTYALTGTAADLEQGYVFTADPGSYAYTGTAANLRESAIVMGADPGTYALTGTVTNFLKGRTVTIDPGSYSLTGTAASLLRTRIMVAVAGSYALTGTAANLIRTRSLSADPGSYSLTGTDAAFLYSQVLQADAGVYSYAGTAADLVTFNAYLLQVDPGAYSLTGTDAAFTIGSFQYWVVEPDPGAVSIADQDDPPAGSIAGEVAPGGGAWVVEDDPALTGQNEGGFNSLFYDPSFYDTSAITWTTEDEPARTAILEET
jgi:hypothetical protein